MMSGHQLFEDIIDPDLDHRTRRVADKFSENINAIANEPSLAFFRIHEHVRKTLPQLVEQKHEVQEVQQKVQGACFDTEYATNAVKMMSQSTVHFQNIQDLLKNAMFMKQQIGYEEIRRRHEMVKPSMYPSSPSRESLYKTVSSQMISTASQTASATTSTLNTTTSKTTTTTTTSAEAAAVTANGTGETVAKTETAVKPGKVHHGKKKNPELSSSAPSIQTTFFVPSSGSQFETQDKTQALVCPDTENNSQREDNPQRVDNSQSKDNPQTDEVTEVTENSCNKESDM